MCHVACAVVATTLLLATQARADAYGYGHASAFAQGVSNDDGSDGDTLGFQHDVSAANNPNGNATPDSLAIARSYGHAFGQSGVYVSVAGHTDRTGTVPTEVSAEASAASFSEFRIESATLPVGTPVTVNLSLQYDGSLSLKADTAGQLSGQDLVSFVYTDVQVGHNGGPMDIVYEGGADLYTDEQFDYGDWESRGIFTSSGTGLWTASFDISDIVAIETTIGSTFQFSPNLWAEASMARASGGEAIVDFYNTSSFSFAPAGGADFAIVPILVPEPGLGIALVVVGGTLLRRRRT